MKPKVILCDIDNCILDSREHIKMIPKCNSREAWDEFAKHYHLCKPNIPMAKMINGFLGSYHIIFLTGRENLPTSIVPVQDITHNSLADCFKGYIPYKLFMRKYNDYRPDHEVKREMLEKYILDNYEPILAIDDKLSNIAVFREFGIPTLHYTIGD